MVAKLHQSMEIRPESPDVNLEIGLDISVVRNTEPCRPRWHLRTRHMTFAGLHWIQTATDTATASCGVELAKDFAAQSP